MRKRLAVIILFLTIILIELALGKSRLPSFNWQRLGLPVQNIINFPLTNKLSETTKEIVLEERIGTPIESQILVQLVNEKRKEEGMLSLVQNSNLQTVSEQKSDSIFEKQDWDKALSTKTLVKNSGYSYRTIGEAYYFSLSEDMDEIVNFWYENANDIIFSSAYKDIGLSTTQGEFQGEQGTLIVAIVGEKYISVPTPTPISIKEADLWNALVQYRKAHQKSQLQLDENLCKYARQRTQELILRLQNLKPGDSPLDGHAGFERDTGSGVAFSQTGFSLLAEDLAYDPPATNSVQIIEWGWDSSAPHRESLLSNDVTHGCVTGVYPIYVAILGRH